MAKPNMHSVGAITRNSITNVDGKEIGKFIDLLIDLKQNDISCGIVSLKRRKGYIAIPWEFFRLGGMNNFLLDVDQSVLDNAPVFSEGKWPNLCSTELQLDFSGLTDKSSSNFPYCNPQSRQRSMMMQQYRETHTFNPSR